MSAQTESEIQEESFPITLLVYGYGNWNLGFAWVNVTVGGIPVTGLALYARRNSPKYGPQEPVRRVVSSHREAADWLLDTIKVPARFSGKLMAKAMSEGDFQR
jgi:hypothetical protein